jgi:aryl-alcohol dehydrogenase-like predicted oxidoreductase
MIIDAAAAGTWKLGDFTVNRMGFGAMRLTADPDPARALEVLRRAIELGVNHIDTAAFYVSPGGTLEIEGGPYRAANDLIRQALAPYPDELVITTKIGPGYDKDGEWAEAVTADALRYQVEQNLRTLGRDVLDVVNLRIMRRTAPLEERFEALAAMQAEGLIRHLGLSSVRPEEVEALSRIAPVVCVQNMYAVDNRRTEDGFVAWCGERGIAFVPFFAIAGAGRESGATTDHDEALLAVARTHGVTPHQVRLAWTLHQGPHVLAIPGTGDPAHLEQNIAAGSLQLSDEEVASLG